MGHLNKAVFGVYKLNSQLANAKQRLLSDGFYNHELDVQYPLRLVNPTFSVFQNTQIKLFASIGALAGGILFSMTAWLIVFGAIPHVNVDGASDLVRQVSIVLAGLVLGFLYGAVSGALVGIGTSRKSSLRYFHYLDAGRIVMSVTAKTNKQKQLAYETLSLTGAQDICTAGENHCWQAVREAVAKAPKIRPTY